MPILVWGCLSFTAQQLADINYVYNRSCKPLLTHFFALTFLTIIKMIKVLFQKLMTPSYRGR